MNCLHTADWHLGQTLHGIDRRYEHRLFLDWLLDQLEAQDIDLLLIAGDVFDSPNPPITALQDLYGFIAECRRRRPHLTTVLIAGNHDSASRIEAPAELLAAFSTISIGQVHRQPDRSLDCARLVHPIRDRHGAIAAWCLAVPFLRASDLPPSAGASYADGVAEVYRQALAHALCQRQAGQPILALGHAHIRDAQVTDGSEAERRIVVGHAEALPTSLFDRQLSYVALGHLHRPQTLGHLPHIHYAGSPFPMSFAERTYHHQVTLIEFDGAELRSLRSLPVPRPVEFMVVPEQPADVDTVLQTLRALQVDALPAERHPYLMVRVRLDGPEPDLRQRIDQALAGQPLRLVRIEVSHRSDTDPAAPVVAASLDDLGCLQPERVFERLYQQHYRVPPPDALRQAFFELLGDDGDTA